jgi:hypothetical protein
VLPVNVIIGVFIAAHLVLVVVRSHGNPRVLKRYWWRLTLVPALLFLALYASPWLSVFAGVLAIWWDVYHSSMQTFGLGRLYERKAGNDVHVGRGLDKILNLFLYVGPILAGATLADHLKFFESFEQVNAVFFTAIPAYVGGYQSLLTWVVLGLAGPFLAYYVYAYRRLAQQGHRTSRQKVFLLTSTGVCSIYTWGFNSFGQAFFIMNFFHALQYFAIVWWSERKNLSRQLRLDGRAFSKPMLLSLFVLVPLGYGAWSFAAPRGHGAVICIVLVINIMHFYFDGFIWSVRKGEV